MKIRKAPSKKLAPLPRQLEDLIKRLETKPKEQIPSLVEELSIWSYPRGDLFHWVKVLDRFDVILQDICNEYDLKQIQTKHFTDQTKTLILSIIDLSCTLFENCTNRNIYNSYEHLCMLLNTFDIDVLQQVLYFMIRPAQRINNPRAIRSSFSVPQDKIIELARGWTNVSVDLMNIIQNLEVTPKMRTFVLQFYRATTTTSALTTNNTNSDKTVVEGNEIITATISEEDLKKDDIEIFLKLVKEHNVPTENQFELANRIRIVKHLNESKTRRQLLGIRILALSIMAHAVSETTAQNKVFIYEPHLVSQLAELISPEKQVDTTLQTYVLYTMDALIRYRTKLPEVLTAVNASTNHGTLMRILRKINSNEAYPQPFLDALFAFVSYLLQTQPGEQMLISAGVIPILVQIMANHQYTRYKNIAKLAGLMDTIVNSFSSSFTAFCNVNGLNTLLNRIKLEVEACSEYIMKDDDVSAPYDRLSSVKAMLKFLLRMMDTSGTADGLRNLIDSNLPYSLKLIMEHPKSFGSNILSLAINIMATFIHNEPTSLSILQEAQLPQSFLNTISSYDVPGSEVMLAAINAFGAVCLNTQGLEMFNKTNPIPHFFELMTTYDYIKNPTDLHGGTALGATMDELVRHQPTLKPILFQCVEDLVKKMIEMGNDMDGDGKPKDNSHVIQTCTEESGQNDVNMLCTPVEVTPIDNSTIEEDKKPAKVDHFYVLFIELVARYLEGIFENQNNINEFVRQIGSETLLSVYSSPLLPATFCSTVANNTYTYVFRMICDVSPLPTVLAIANKAKESIRFIIERKDGYQKSCLVEFVDVNPNETEKIERGNKLLHQLIEMQAITSLLSNLSSSVLTQSKNGPSLLTEFLAVPEEGNIIQALGQLYRVAVWENLLLKEELPNDWYNYKASGIDDDSNTRNNASGEANQEIESGSATGNTTNATVSGDSSSATTRKILSAKDPRIINIKHFKFLLKDIPQLLMLIFQGLIKVSVSRRAGTTVSKAQTMELAEYMASLLKDNITWQPINNSNAPACKYDYLASAYNMTSFLLRDERPQSSFQTPLAIAFDRKGGIDLLLEHLKQLWDKVLTLYEDDKEENRELISRINTSIENLLNVLLNISSPKLLRDSAYTAGLIQKNRKAKDYFEPYQWIVALELKLTPLKEYLMCPKLHLFSRKVSQTFIKIFQQIMKGEGGFSNSIHSTTTNTRHGGDVFSSLNTPLMTAPFTLLRAPVVASEHNIQTLLDMGFERAAAEQALVRCNNQVSRAVDYLFSHPTPVFSTPATSNAVRSTEEASSHHADANAGDDDDENNPNNEENTQEDEHFEGDDNNDSENHHHNDNQEDEDNDDNDSDNDMEDITGNFVDSLNSELNMARGSGLRHFSLDFINNNEDNNNEEDNDESDVEEIVVSENLEKLKAFRQELCELLPAPLLALSDEREDLMFDVRDLLVLLGKNQDAKSTTEDSTSSRTTTSVTKTSLMIISMLLDWVAEIRHDKSKSLLLASRLRLLALLLREPPMQKTMIKLSDRFLFLLDMLEFMNVEQDEPLPTWSATLFLVLETLIAQADEPKRVKLSAPCRHPLLDSSSSFTEDEEENNDNTNNNIDGEDVIMQDAASVSAINAINVTYEQRIKLLECSVSLLRKSKLSRDEIYAILRMVVRLTKDHSSALHFVGIGGMPLLFSKPRSSLDGLQGQQVYIILILRHIVESKAVLESAMKEIIINWFTNPRPRNMDITSFIRSNAHVALRDPSVFVEVITDICRLARYDEFEVNRHIRLKKQDKEEKNDGEEASAATSTSYLKEKSPSEVVIYYLLNEVMNVRSEVTAMAAKKEKLTEEQKKEENVKFVYTGFLLQCLVELISSYPSCKYDIFNFCKKQNGPRATSSDGKHRSFVSMLINDLLPYNHTNPTSDESRKQQGLSTWTASTLVAMSYDTSSNSGLTLQQKNELMQVRKYVLEAIIRALKEAIASTEPPSIKYARYLAFADLCHRILNARPNFGPFAPRTLSNGHNSSSTNSKEEGTLSNAKIMLDKNFVAILTSAVSDIDINYPHSRAILNALIRPLEQLTKLAIKTDEVTDTDEEEQDKMDTIEETMHVPNTPAEEQDEAPDLYRNSALGMFDGSVIDEDEYNSEEYSDMFGSSAEDEDDYAEDSESDLSDEVDEETEEMETMMHSGDYDTDEMDEDEEDSDDIDDEDELVDDEEEEEEEEEDGREMTWHLEDIEEEPGIVHTATIIEAGDENDEQVHIRNMSDPYDEDEDDDEEEMDALSDFDDASSNAENISTNDPSDGILLDAEDLDTPFLPTDLQDDLDIDNDDLTRPRTILHAAFRRRFPDGRRSLLEGVGRPFRTPVQAQEDVITHPLLSNNNASPGFSTGTSTRNAIEEAFSRRAHGSGLSNWQDFEDIIGGSAARMLEDLLTRSPPISQSGSLRIDVQSAPGGALRTFEFDRLPSLNATDTNRGSNVTRTGNEPDNQVQESLAILQDFQPMSSGERWNQEARMMYGTNISEKALKLVNELLNILIPIAIEDDKKAREEEEKRRQEQRRQEEEKRRNVEEQTWRLEKEVRKAMDKIKDEIETVETVETDATGAQTAEASGSSIVEPSTAEPLSTDDHMSTGEPQSQTENTDVIAENDNDAERTIITIHGETVDISGMGIDVEFLEALPDDLREEVINQHMRERPTPVQPAEDDSISPEFLDALPPDIREEVLHQEAIERERRERQNRQASTNTPSSANATNTGTAAASSFEDISSRRRPASTEDDSRVSGPVKKKAKSRCIDSAAQLLEKSQLSTLVRLLFIPQTISKSLLNRLLLNLCENSKTRSELLSYLVCVLYDGDNDLNSVDNSFALLNSSGKGSKSVQSKSSKNMSVASSITDNAPNFIAQRCLEALTYIISCNDQSMTYFLTESETLANLKRVSSSRKGKSKEKVPANWNRYPILLLMSLLDRSVFIYNSALMEQLMDLLSTMCRPFPILVKKYKEKLENKQKDPNSSERPMPKPPTIPDYYLKLVVHVLTNGECSSKTFQYTLNAISHLSALEGAQSTIVSELVEDAKKSGSQILKDLEALLKVLSTTIDGAEVSSIALAPFSAATSDQAKLLRVLKTLDYIFTRKSSTAPESETKKDDLVKAQMDNESRITEICKNLNFSPLWNTLGKCLSVIHEKEELINVATVLLPLIESFMVVSKCTAERSHNADNGTPQASATDPTRRLSHVYPGSLFYTFTEKHKKVLNIMVRKNPSLMSGSFALLVRNPKMLEFDNKRNYFVQQLHKRTTPRENYPPLQLNVRRHNVFEDSYHQLQGRTGDEFKHGKLAVRFYNEEGVDAGGVSREWFSVLARQMFDPNYALFIKSAADKLTYQPNRDSAVNPDHLSFFKFVGRVIGKAIYDGRLLDAYFTRSFYKHILGRSVDYRDVEALDPEYYKSLVWMLENDITDIIDLTFSIETDYFGTKETVDLKPNGRNIPVTEENKHEYVALVTEQKLTTAIKDQINAFVQGFHDIIPAHLIQIFNEQELELLISGLPDIDIDDWKNNTEYQGYTSSSPPVQWFWRAVRSFDQEERAKLLQFATGTSKVPLEGFSQLQGSNGVQKFQIHKDFGGEKRLPSAHTCFNQVDLPQYDSYESLRANLFKAISECSTGFAFV
ncbi:MAG: hypothetical protein EXX96DRAFT_362871 [Benjaminiella poitrasii]|nr:MAG: hypothetical protein EXX96DRAFT_362871 [Benjaminiella poitrasii]